MTRRPRRTDRGAATAELAMTLPILVAVTIGLVWLLAVGAAQVRVVDAARETARAAARGDAEGEAVARGRRVAPAGATVTLSRSGDEVRVVASGEVHGPGGLFGFLPGVTVRAEAVAAAEEEGP
ncbi:MULTISPECIES: TadE family type IV pilus minor pilin [Nocardioides]|uniref:TadE-like protein n=1 Tax=Nocardioides lianchengensis TaxID=1045774 RepID=A0A1G6PVM8_9ACTN|nr:TadE family type IV pilus minor pilin [Nocardioides lianchengensis]NYG11997.1 Flp pilus assembly protein TadG [Nocardioides lianchengensis]SDC84163.1 TadE-like protein [Nocardioides lianchengensis]